MFAKNKKTSKKHDEMFAKNKKTSKKHNLLSKE